MVLLLLVQVLLLLVMVLLLVLLLQLLLDMMLLPAQLPPLLLSAQVFQSRPVTRFLFLPQERLPKLSARRLLISRSSRTVPKLSAPLALSNLSNNLTLLLLLEL